MHITDSQSGTQSPCLGCVAELVPRAEISFSRSHCACPPRQKKGVAKHASLSIGSRDLEQNHNIRNPGEDPLSVVTQLISYLSVQQARCLVGRKRVIEKEDTKKKHISPRAYLAPVTPSVTHVRTSGIHAATWRLPLQPTDSLYIPTPPKKQHRNLWINLSKTIRQ